MNLLNKLTIINLKLNKKRTIVTIIGIILSVALICVVATMYSSMIESLINFEVTKKGNFHVAYYDVSSDDVKTIRNTRGVDDIYFTKDIGYAKLNKSKNEYKPYAFVKGFTKKSLKNLSVVLVDGRLPQKENEILIPTHLKTNGRVVLNIGDDITLNVGKRVTEDGYQLGQSNPYNPDIFEEITNVKSQTYKVVGVIERPAFNVEYYKAPGYTFITYLDEKNVSGKLDCYVRYTKKGSKEYTKVTSAILGVNRKLFEIDLKGGYDGLSKEEIIKVQNERTKIKYDYNINTYLIALENNPLDDESAGSLGIAVLVVIIIIIITSVFCIKNSFDISITEKIKQYGMLRSIGATKKQIRKNVFYEATLLGLFGIPLGLLLGIVAAYILVFVSNFFLRDLFLLEGMKLILSYSWLAFLVAIILGIVTIYLSAMRSAKMASKVSAIDSIRNSANIKINSKKIKCPNIIRKIFKIGGEISYKNLKRNKKKYRTTIISITVSVSIFIALSYFINSAFDQVEEDLDMGGHNIVLNSGYGGYPTDEFIEKANETFSLDNIKNYAIFQNGTIKIKSPRYNKTYIDLMGLDKNFENKDRYFGIISIGDYQYKKYLKELNINDNGKLAILLDKTTVTYKNDKGKEEQRILNTLDYKKGDKIEIINEKNGIDFKLEVYLTDIKPFGLTGERDMLIVSDKLMSKIKDDSFEYSIRYDSSNASKLQDDIESLFGEVEFELFNKEEDAKIMRSIYTLIAIFLYGFIIVISLIGVTNIFNTITTNMQLRKQEFAMLKSIGMTKKEFNNMIRLESLFMGFKSLVIGITIGIGLSYVLYNSLNMEMGGFKFKIPVVSIIICIIVVYLLITILMKYSLNKISKQNTIETIRNENI